jgi:hypothetical protein
MGFGHLIGPRLNLVGLDFHRFAATAANQVVVVPLTAGPIQKLPLGRLQGVGLA